MDQNIEDIEEFKVDSYVVEIIPPVILVPFPRICITEQAQRGKLREFHLGKFLDVSSKDFDSKLVDETARKIGRAILEVSGIVKDYRGQRSTWQS